MLSVFNIIHVMSSKMVQSDPREPATFKIKSTQLFFYKFTFIYTKLKLKTCHTRWLILKIISVR
jgi:hypothetical protein